MQTIETVILGAGLTGLSCAYHLGSEYEIFEKESEPGGMVRTHVRDTPEGRFYCDITGHWLHLRNSEMRALVDSLLPCQLAKHNRHAVISMKGVFTPYPFQANTYGLPREVVLDCLLGVLKARHPEDFGLKAPEGRPQNFRESLERLFGEGICRHFMLPYNEKLMGVSLEEISPEYADRFIPQPSLEDVVRGALGFSKEALGYNAHFVYPKEGGIGALARALAAALPVAPRYNTKVRSIDLKARTITLDSGETYGYRYLLNTIPLIAFIRMIGELPEVVAAAADKLRAITVYYYNIGVKGPGAEASGHHWTYFPEPDYIFYRTGSYSAAHPELAPEGCRSYYVEMSGGIAELRKDPEALRSRVLKDLQRARILSPEDEILFMELREMPWAYVIFDKNYVDVRQTLLNFLTQSGVQSCGRWGGWNYGGMEDAMLEGRQAAQNILAALAKG